MLYEAPIYLDDVSQGVSYVSPGSLLSSLALRHKKCLENALLKYRWTAEEVSWYHSGQSSLCRAQ